MIIVGKSSLKKVAIALHYKRTFFEENYEFMPFLNVDLKNTIQNDSVKVFVPTFDFSDPIKRSSLSGTAKKADNYFMGLVNDLKINPIEIFKPVETFTYSNFIVQPMNQKIKTEGSMSVPVLFPFAPTDFNSCFLQIVWKLGVYAFVPFFINTDLSPKNIGGPLFVKNYNISVTENAPVNVDFDFVGGVSILPPSPYKDNGLLGKQKYPTVGISTLVGTVNYFTYRMAKHYDCFFTLGVKPVETGIGNSSIYQSYLGICKFFTSQDINISSMSLKIENELTESYTANQNTGNTIIDGDIIIDLSNTINIISLKKRRVSGKVEFVSSSNLVESFNAAKIKQLTMYFGGPFYYPMNNVTMNVSGFELKGEAGYYSHTVNFTANLQQSKYKSYYLQNEFDINQSGLYHTPSGNIYVEPQDPL